jgi:hypothetical protein
VTGSYGWGAARTDYFALMERDSNHSARHFGDRLLSTNLYSLFGPPSGGLWIGYTLGGFSFLDKGRVTNYVSETGSVYGFAEDRDGILWAGTSSGLWRFDHLVYLIPGTGHFKTAGSNLSVDGFTWEPDRTILTAPVAPRVSDFGKGSDERLLAYPVTKKPFKLSIETTVFGSHPRISPA